MSNLRLSMRVDELAGSGSLTVGEAIAAALAEENKACTCAMPGDTCPRHVYAMA